MHINITDEIVSQFLSGAVVVLVLIGMGSLLLFILRGMQNTFPFTRMGVALGLAPLSLINFMNYGESSFLLLYTMIAALLGISIDGINYLLSPKERIKRERPTIEKEKSAETPEPGPGVIVWEKAE